MRTLLIVYEHGTLYTLVSTSVAPYYVLYALSARTGATLWTLLLPHPPDNFSLLAVANGVVYINLTDGHHKYTLYALNASTGTTLWTAALSEVFVSGITIANGVLYDGVGRSVYMFNATGCGSQVCSSIATFGTANRNPLISIVVNGMVYVTTFQGGVLAFHLG